jgi:hypothetical protein
MKCYLAVSGIIFFLIILAHAARIVAEGARLLREPDFILASIVAAGMSIWAFVLFRRCK